MRKLVSIRTLGNQGQIIMWEPPITPPSPPTGPPIQPQQPERRPLNVPPAPVEPNPDRDTDHDENNENDGGSRQSDHDQPPIIPLNPNQP